MGLQETLNKMKSTRAAIVKTPMPAAVNQALQKIQKLPDAAQSVESLISEDTRQKLILNSSSVLKKETAPTKIASTTTSAKKSTAPTRLSSAEITRLIQSSNNSGSGRNRGGITHVFNTRSQVAMHRFGSSASMEDGRDVATAGRNPVNWLVEQTAGPFDFGTDYMSGRDLFISFRDNINARGYTTQSWIINMSTYTGEIRKLMRDHVCTANPFAMQMAQFFMDHFGLICKMDPDSMQSARLAMQYTGFMKDVIMPNLFGKFGDMVVASAFHPSMLWHLTGEYNGNEGNPGNSDVGSANQNYARELMELHTLSNDPSNYPAGSAVYTQDHVRMLSHILSGRYIGQYSGQPLYEIMMHRVHHRHAGSSSVAPQYYLGRGFDMRPVVDFVVDRYVNYNELLLKQEILDNQRRVVRMLANHPATAKNLVKKMVRYFITDNINSPQATEIINAMYDVWMATEGDIGAVARAMVTHRYALAVNESWMVRKIKQPIKYVVGTLRASGLLPRSARRATSPVQLTDAHLAILDNAAFGTLDKMNQKLGHAPDVRGYRSDNDIWISPNALYERLMFSMQMAEQIATRYTASDFYRFSMGSIALLAYPSNRESRVQQAPNPIAAMLMSPTHIYS